jgi:hypothetical protein
MLSPSFAAVQPASVMDLDAGGAWAPAPTDKTGAATLAPSAIQRREWFMRAKGIGNRHAAQSFFVLERYLSAINPRFDEV